MIVRDWRGEADRLAARHQRWLSEQNTEPVAVAPVVVAAPRVPTTPAQDPFPHICAGRKCAVCLWVRTHPRVM